MSDETASDERLDLLLKVSRLELTVQDRDRELLNLRCELECLTSTIKIRDLEIKELMAVIARNYTRVQAETALEARKIARATQPTRGPEVE